jgi:hypothetical protein
MYVDWLSQLLTMVQWKGQGSVLAFLVFWLFTFPVVYIVVGGACGSRNLGRQRASIPVAVSRPMAVSENNFVQDNSSYSAFQPLTTSHSPLSLSRSGTHLKIVALAVDLHPPPICYPETTRWTRTFLLAHLCSLTIEHRPERPIDFPVAPGHRRLKADR